MSLLNDALKRAENARTDALPASPALQPVIFTRVQNRPSILLPVLILLTLLLAAFFIWQWYIGVVPVKARSQPMLARDEIKPRPPPAEPTPKTNLPAAAVAPQKPATAPPTAAGTNSVVSSISTAMTNLIAAVAAVKPPVYKLQSIFFRPNSPSAVINGQTLFIGDRIGRAVLTAVTSSSATLSTPDGQTQVLELSQ